MDLQQSYGDVAKLCEDYVAEENNHAPMIKLARVPERAMLEKVI